MWLATSGKEKSTKDAQLDYASPWQETCSEQSLGRMIWRSLAASLVRRLVDPSVSPHALSLFLLRHGPVSHFARVGIRSFRHRLGMSSLDRHNIPQANVAIDRWKSTSMLYAVLQSFQPKACEPKHDYRPTCMYSAELAYPRARCLMCWSDPPGT